MLFLAWLGVSFIVVAVINLYLRRFGLPRRQLSSGTVVDGKALSTSSGLSQFYSVTASTLSSTASHGESARWINNILAWIYSQVASSGQKAELLNIWLKSLTEQAEFHSRDVRVKFDDIHGSLPEFSNFSIDPSTAVSGQTGLTSSELTVYLAVLAKDITFQTCVVTQTAESSRTVYADVYLLHLQGQLKVTVSRLNASGEAPLLISFVTAPELRLQVIPSGRLDASTDLSSIEKVVKTALCDTTIRVTWSSVGGFRSITTSTPHATVKTENQYFRNTAVTPGGQLATQQSFTGAQSTAGLRDIPQQLNAYAPQYSQPHYASQLHQQQQQLQQQQQQLQQQYIPLQSAQQQPISPGSLADTSRYNVDPMMRSQGVIPLQDSLGARMTQRLLIKVIKANGLAEDLGTCNAYCVVRIDRPAQNFITSVVRNTVNPMWDEQFVFEVDSFTSQVQFDVLDRDKQPDSELLGKASVQLDEIRRMPSSRQILPLTGRLRSRTATSGSVTVEFALMDAADVATIPVSDNISPVHVTPQHAMQPLNVGNFSPTNNPAASFNDTTMKSDVASGDYGSYQNRLSAHDLALSQRQQGYIASASGRPQDSPAVVVTGTEQQRSNVQGTLDGRGRGQQPKESFASALKKRLSRAGGKKRSQSADRVQQQGRSFQDGSSYLRPPADSQQQQPDEDHKARSNSFTSSLRRIFKPSTGGKKDISRGGSLNRNSPSDQSQQYQLQQGYNYDRSLRQSTPVPPGADRRGTDQYGNTLPAEAEQRGLGEQYGNTLTATASPTSLNVGRY